MSILGTMVGSVANRINFRNWKMVKFLGSLWKFSSYRELERYRFAKLVGFSVLMD